MAIRPIILIPDQRLKTESEPVTDITDEIRTLAADMLETMYDAPGIGLAAVQIGVMKRLLVIDVAGKEEPRAPMVVINPEITWASDEEFSIHEEGCLSIPDYYEEVERPAKIRVRYMDLDGKTLEIDAEGILATCLQHEIDHLDGVLFIDYLSKLKRDRVMKKFTKAAKREAVD
ncbi:peptide deformylase [Chelatococcus asaccharovorans]|uniref:Peptide deformylase n=1 Tax=Chelatococcus asaccharovorans TaxID=28210 RepID=A0A2V3UV17_9HYPH|nr:peptide deformylase [Chelatococcus asaccharovorans]MBS7701716.1 peptide deformylase [Chelatococcus asaccharovorans]PXW64578.1 peptide deformylase [Chelatococcus asaccharovorans]CAH1664940.1 Peptide deformylase [Chelatococcus asaccharovorans]CAH1682176.1 Peptide deformylase [Chelatococcus asaccharovorans]